MSGQGGRRFITIFLQNPERLKSNFGLEMGGIFTRERSQTGSAVNEKRHRRRKPETFGAQLS